ncbi:acyltransferase-domain-containing protein [Calycina marina]|uniref:Acyltransferase-domain-containing protein n=1 Tax=Calycina marina TaxID=1763456 RepID=A0A9P7ZA43_9HELO|nr:acyltransferase-domain-containing protein [Calycina marina]
MSVKMASEPSMRRKPAEEQNITKPETPAVIKSLRKSRGVRVDHPGGEIKHGLGMQILRIILATIYTIATCISIVTTQLVGLPLYWYNKDLYYAYMALTKQSFGIYVTSFTQWWSPTVVRISGDASVAGELVKTENGGVQLQFPDRLVLIANHQLYSDWLYLWWAAYTNKRKMHGHIYIILKESLKHIPIVGWGMMFYGFIFMSRKMATDQPRIAHRLNKLKERHSGPLSGEKGLDPMWLLLFPEGTNASPNMRIKSAEWAEKTGVADVKHTLLPRSTGSLFCLNELENTVDYVYDCTLAYEGIECGEYGQDLYTLRSMYFAGQPPPSVNMYWRKFAIKDIPLQDGEKFDLWLRERWYEKDAIMEEYASTGRFPVSPSESEEDFIETEVKLSHRWEVGNIFVVLAALGLIFNLLGRAWSVVGFGKR